MVEWTPRSSEELHRWGPAHYDCAAMSRVRFQFGLGHVLLMVACVAFVLGAAQGSIARDFILGCSMGVVLLAPAVLLLVTVALGREAAAAGVRIPGKLRRGMFQRKLARLRPGVSSHRVRTLLGSPARVDGFGDRTYWCYKIAGQRFVVSLDPRKLVATYSNGLSRD